MSQPLTPAPPAMPKALAKPPQATPQKPQRVAFDPLDPQWQPGAAPSAATPSDEAASTSTKPRAARKAAPLDVESLRRQEQADTIVVSARRAFVRGDAGTAREQIKQAFAIDASNAAGLELLGDIFLSEAEQEKAIQVFRRGAEKHPENGVFEEKIGLALLDISEEQRDKDVAAMLLADPSSLRWAERKPGLAASLSLLVPGAGQFYNDEPERGSVLVGSAILLFGGWYWIFNGATSNVPGRRIMTGAGDALAQMGALAKLGFWVMLLAWLAVVAYAVADAYQGARDANRAHRPFEV